MAEDELAEATGHDPSGLGEPYEYQWRDLIADAKSGNKEVAKDGKDYDANAASAWKHMRLHDALAYAEGRYKSNEWSPRIRWRAGILDLAHPEVGIRQVFDIYSRTQTGRVRKQSKQP